MVRIDASWEQYHRGLEKTVRKELERSWRVFSREPATRFAQVSEPAEAQRIVAIMERQQRARMEEAGKAYTLDAPQITAFYRELVAGGIGGGYAILTALLAGEDVIAALLGIRRGDHYVMVRISNVGREWSQCSPGRLIIHRSMEHLHALGCRAFDFSIGNYAYKRRLGVAAKPLVDLIVPLTWRGTPALARSRMAEKLRAYPALDARIRRLAGRPVAEE
jgi:CelD/BcsL family acetyltransferase involved in cellulose biosynthesis